MGRAVRVPRGQGETGCGGGPCGDSSGRLDLGLPAAASIVPAGIFPSQVPPVAGGHGAVALSSQTVPATLGVLGCPRPGRGLMGYWVGRTRGSGLTAALAPPPRPSQELVEKASHVLAAPQALPQLRAGGWPRPRGSLLGEGTGCLVWMRPFGTAVTPCDSRPSLSLFAAHLGGCEWVRAWASPVSLPLAGCCQGERAGTRGDARPRLPDCVSVFPPAGVPTAATRGRGTKIGFPSACRAPVQENRSGAGLAGLCRRHQLTRAGHFRALQSRKQNADAFATAGFVQCNARFCSGSGRGRRCA